MLCGICWASWGAPTSDSARAEIVSRICSRKFCEYYWELIFNRPKPPPSICWTCATLSPVADLNNCLRIAERPEPVTQLTWINRTRNPSGLNATRSCE